MTALDAPRRRRTRRPKRPPLQPPLPPNERLHVHLPPRHQKRRLAAEIAPGVREKLHRTYERTAEHAGVYALVVARLADGVLEILCDLHRQDLDV